MSREREGAAEPRYGVHIRCWKVPGERVQHYYGRIWRRWKNKGQSDEEEMRYPVTADEAAALNEKDNQSWAGMTGPALRRGDLCRRYGDRGRLVDDALARIEKRWKHQGRVECGDEGGCENPLLQEEDGSRGPAAAADAE